MTDWNSSSSEPGVAARAADHATDAMRAGHEIADAFAALVGRVGDLIDDARAPGKPLDTLSNLTRKAPLGALAAAFVVGIMVARRR